MLLACEILVPSPGFEPASSAVKVPNPDHWITREFPEVAGFEDGGKAKEYGQPPEAGKGKETGFFSAASKTLILAL